MKLTTTVLASLAFAGFSQAAQSFSNEDFKNWMNEDEATALSGKESFPQLRTKILRRFIDWAGDFLAVTAPEHDMTTSDDDYPYFNFMPQFQGAAIPDGETASWEGLCFKQNVASASTNADGSVTFTVTSSKPASLLCSDYYVFMTTSGYDFQKISSHGDHTFTWTLPDWAATSDSWDVSNKGIRVLMFMNSFATCIKNALETALLFVPEFTQGVDRFSAARNLDFLEKYSGFTMPARKESDNVVLDESEIHSGDFFGVIRLDGLDPMLAWAMGSTTGHTTVALWFDDGLYVVESTVTDSYWPTDGIQRTPYKTWVEQAKAAGYNTVHVPLSEESRANFNTQAAIDFFYTVEGLEYGYQNLLWGWIDTETDNYPCLPPDYSSQCLQFEFLETAFALIDHAIPDIADALWIQAWNKRVGTTGLRTADIYYQGALNGIKSKDIPAIVEQDSWLYTTLLHQNETVVGLSQVCCVMVCNVWKHAGVFGDLDFNCGEQTNVDDYALGIFAGTYAQITGEYTLTLNNFNTRIPYAHMDEQCESLAPDYARSDNC